MTGAVDRFPNAPPLVGQQVLAWGYRDCTDQWNLLGDFALLSDKRELSFSTTMANRSWIRDRMGFASITLSEIQHRIEKQSSLHVVELFQSSAAIMASRWDIARRLVDQNPDEWRSDHLRAWALRNRGVFHAYVGEFGRAVDFLRQAGMASGLRTHEGGSAGVPASALHALAELYYLNGESGAARMEVERALSMQPESFRGLYFAGRMALFDDDVDAATRYLEALAKLPATESSASARVYHAAPSGELALYSGDVDRAVVSFERATSGSLMLDWASTCSSAGAAIRDGLARGYLASGDTRRAVAAMEAILSGGAERLDHPVIYASTLYRLGVLELERGRVEEGRRLLRRFVGLWGGADWKLEIVEDAESRLGS